MAESVVSLVVENLVQLIKEEVRSYRGMGKKVQSLKDKLESMNLYLQGPEVVEYGINAQNDLVKEKFVEKIREVAREAEAVADKYMAHVAKQSKRNMVLKLFHWQDVRDIPGAISSIETFIEDCLRNKDQFALPEGQQQQQQDYAAEAADVVDLEAEKDVGVGFADHVRELVSRLTDEGNAKRDVVSITGMVGSGKTKLAMNIFHDAAVGKRFKCRAFVFGSWEKHNTKSWLVQTLKALKYETNHLLDDMQPQQLVATVRERLKGKRYLVVLDGMWNDKVWSVVKKAFPDEKNGSRILITCREKAVASKDDRKHPPYDLPFLDAGNSWKILRDRVFGKGKDCDEDVTRNGMRLAEECNGLPLSIVKIADLLKERNYSPETVSDTGRIMEKQEEICLGVVEESYKQLPRCLKVCFLYLGLFPKDFEISATQLIQLWSAEGFITAPKKSDVIKVAGEYLDELVNRNLIQVASLRSDRRVKTCRVHNLLRKLSIREGTKEKFLDVRDSDANYDPSHKIPRILCIQGNISQRINSSYKHYPSPPPRSLLFFGQRKHDYIQEEWQAICKSFKNTRVLYFWELPMRLIPKEIDKLFYLTYIRIACSDEEMLRIKALPASICKLPSLETIDIKGQVEETLPDGIWRMERLRHLKVSKGMRLPSRPKLSSTSRHLKVSPTNQRIRILCGLVVEKCAYLLVDHVAAEFPDIEKLHLLYDSNNPLEESEVKQLFKSIGNLKVLKSLKIVSFPRSGYHPDMFPLTLEKITITSSYLDSYRFRVLGEFQNLRFLKIIRTHDTASTEFDKLKCYAESFPKLEFFKICGLQISRWKMDDTAMPKLRQVVIEECDRLQNFPPKIQHMLEPGVIVNGVTNTVYGFNIRSLIISPSPSPFFPPFLFLLFLFLPLFFPLISRILLTNSAEIN